MLGNPSAVQLSVRSINFMCNMYGTANPFYWWLWAQMSVPSYPRANARRVRASCAWIYICICVLLGINFELSTHPSWHLRLNSLFDCVCGLICWFVLYTHINIYIYLHIYIDLQPHNIWGVSAAKLKVNVYLKHIYTYMLRISVGI